MRKSNYDKYPVLDVPGQASACVAGWLMIAARLRPALAARGAGGKTVLVVETYPGVNDAEVLPSLRRLAQAQHVFDAADAFLSPESVEQLTARDVTDDPVFGRLSLLTIDDFLDPGKVRAARQRISSVRSGVVLVYGTGASRVIDPGTPHLLVYADMARWEIQMRQRRSQTRNLGLRNVGEGPASQYKRAFFVDWRVADRLKRELLGRVDFFLDTNVPNDPKLAAGDAVRAGLKRATTRPFRVVPFFDPGPWGGQWMKEVCDLDRSAPNYAWCFDCVPEENSLVLGFGQNRFELPSIDLVFQHPRELLGDAVYGRFGAEFPIRFDFLDTMDGGNLSLQVHPLTEYIQQTFGMHYTQDESYYLLDAKEGGASVYLGFKDGVNPQAFVESLELAQAGGAPVDVERFVNKLAAKKHDHFLIPAGTIHCSGRDSMVLEISATPYIFTFKLWDWARMGLDGKPRPIHIGHGKRVLQYDRTTAWVKRELVNVVEPIAAGDGWREERTGLHRSEFIETRRHWFTGSCPHDTAGGVNVLNLVEGEEAVVESPDGAFEPFIVHYAETFIVPAEVGGYSIRPRAPGAGSECGTIKAFVRT